MLSLKRMYKLSSVTNANSLICKGILKEIYDENPKYWPHGLDMSAHDSMYLIHSKTANAPIGFVGFQKKSEFEGKTIGYYTIGIKQAYRNQGFAKQAVQLLLKHYEPEVDEFKALIMSNNTPSLNLAKTLNVDTVIKQASLSHIQNTLNKAQKHLDFVNTYDPREQIRIREEEIKEKEQQAAQKLRDNEQKRYERQIAKYRKDQERQNDKARKETEKQYAEYHQKIKDNISALMLNSNTNDSMTLKEELETNKLEAEKAEMEESKKIKEQSKYPATIRTQKDPNEKTMTIQDTFYKKMAFTKTAGNTRAILSQLGLGGVGAAAGYGASEYLLNPLMGRAGTSEYMQDVNTGLNVAMGALAPRLAKRKMLEKTLLYGLLKEPALMGIDAVSRLADTGTAFVNQVIPTLDKAYETAALSADTAKVVSEATSKTTEQLNPLLESFSNMGNSQKLLAILFGTGLLGAGGLATYNMFKKPDVRDKNVALQIPSSKLNDNFYNSLSRNMLFYTPEQKKERIKELQEEEENNKKVATTEVKTTEAKQYKPSSGLFTSLADVGINVLSGMVEPTIKPFIDFLSAGSPIKNDIRELGSLTPSSKIEKNRNAINIALGNLQQARPIV